MKTKNPFYWQCQRFFKKFIGPRLKKILKNKGPKLRKKFKPP